jgi:hypothetical protein
VQKRWANKLVIVSGRCSGMPHLPFMPCESPV